MGASFKRVTKGEGIENVLKNSENVSLKVGFLKGLGEHPNSMEGQTIIEIAFWNEYGTENIPARPFMRSTLNDEIDSYRKLLEVMLSRILRFESKPKQEIKKLGALVTSDIKQKITSLSDPANTERTKQQKGSSNPLIDSGTLRNSVTWEVV